MQVKHQSVTSCSLGPQMQRLCCLHSIHLQVRPIGHDPISTAKVSFCAKCLPVAAPLGLRGWRRAADVLEREHGLDVTDQFPQHLGGLSKKFVTKITTAIGEQCVTTCPRKFCCRLTTQAHIFPHSLPKFVNEPCLTFVLAQQHNFKEFPPPSTLVQWESHYFV